MANNMSNYLEAAVLNLLRGQTYTAPSAVYVALFTTAVDENGAGTEVGAGVGYTRKQVTFSAPSNGAVSNSADVLFDVATGSGFGNVQSVGVFDAASAGNCLYAGALASAKTVAAGDQFKIASGSLTISLD